MNAAHKRAAETVCCKRGYGSGQWGVTENPCPETATRNDYVYRRDTEYRSVEYFAQQRYTSTCYGELLVLESSDLIRDVLQLRGIPSSRYFSVPRPYLGQGCENLLFRCLQLHFRGSLASQRQFIATRTCCDTCHHNAA